MTTARFFFDLTKELLYGSRPCSKGLSVALADGAKYSTVFLTDRNCRLVRVALASEVGVRPAG